MKITADLVEKAKNGDSSAWNELYSSTFPVAYGVAVQLVKNKDIAEDIIQDSYITAFTKLDTLQDTDKFQHWFNRIVANNCKNYLVKKKPDLFSQHSTFTEDGEELEFDVVDDRTEYQPDNAVISDEIKQLFYDMIAKLPEEQRTCALMFWVQELTIPEIAEILGVSQNTVKSRIHYAKKKMTAEAEEMKKKGVSVFSFSGFALVPFLRWLFKNGSGVVAEPEKAEGILKIAKSAGTISKSANTAKAVAETAKTVSKVGGAVKGVSTVGAGAITKGIATKIIAGVLAVVIGATGITHIVKNKTEDVINDDTQTTLADEQSTQDEIIIAESLADLKLNPEMVKSVTAILNSEVVGFDAGNALDVQYYTGSQTVDKWFYVYWVYYYLTMNGFYDGNELKRNEQFQNEFISKYGEYADNLYPDKEVCGIPDYDSFSKLYDCLYGKKDVEQEYKKLQNMVMDKKEFPKAYGMRPIDINFDDEKFISLDNGEYQVEYTITTYHGSGDVEVEANGYAYAYASPTEVYKYVMSFKMDENSVLGFVVTDSYMEQTDTYYTITYVDNNGETETVTTREDIDTITSPGFVPQVEKEESTTQKQEESTTQKQEEATTRKDDELVEIDLFSTIDTIGIKTNTNVTTYQDTFPLVVTFNDEDMQIDYGVCKISWTELVNDTITYTIEYTNESKQTVTEQFKMRLVSSKGSEYVAGEKITARLNIKSDTFKEYGFVFSPTEKQMNVDYIYKLMRDDNISSKDFNTLKQRATSEAEKEYGTVKYETAYLVAKSPKYYGSDIIYIFKQESTGRYTGYTYSSMITNQYGGVLGIDKHKPSEYRRVGLYASVDEIMSSFGNKAGEDGIIIELKK